MKTAVLLLGYLTAILAATGQGQGVIPIDVTGTPDDHQISWTTETGFNDQLFVSADLQNWMDTGINEPGLGQLVTYQCSCEPPYPDKLFYGIVRTEDLYNEGFLIRPTEAEEFDELDGVCFAFNLDVLPSLPEKVRIYKRPYNTGAEWELIGVLTDFGSPDGVPTLRGSAVWVPDGTETGEYEVQAAALNSNETVVASATRLVTIGNNHAPTITIDDLRFPNGDPLIAEFVTTVDDSPENDLITRVEFYDEVNGLNVLIGTDLEEQFGNSLVDPYHQNIEWELLRGEHRISAKAYDNRGAIGETTTDFVVDVTTGNARPQLTMTAPQTEIAIQQGLSFVTEFTLSDADGITDIVRVDGEDIVDANLGEEDTEAPFEQFEQLSVSTSGWEPGTHVLRIFATDASGAESYPQYLTVHVQSGSESTFAFDLVENIAADDASVDPFNERFKGIQLSSAEFISGGLSSGLEFDSGVVLTTGAAELWNAGDIGEQTSEFDVDGFPDRREPGDPQLEDRVTGYQSFDFEDEAETFDAAVLEFDVDCMFGQLELLYQFASEEYSEWVGYFNDGFVVLIDDVVVSLLPDCSDIIAANSVSDKPGFDNNEHLYIDDSELTGFDPQLEYDGVTISLRVHAFVIPGIHHIKIVIADVNSPIGGILDHTRDSAVFISTGSLRTIDVTP